MTAPFPQEHLPASARGNLHQEDFRIWLTTYIDQDSTALGEAKRKYLILKLPQSIKCPEAHLVLPERTTLFSVHFLLPCHDATRADCPSRRKPGAEGGYGAGRAVPSTAKAHPTASSGGIRMRLGQEPGPAQSLVTT